MPALRQLPEPVVELLARQLMISKVFMAYSKIYLRAEKRFHDHGAGAGAGNDAGEPSATYGAFDDREASVGMSRRRAALGGVRSRPSGRPRMCTS